MSKSKVARRSSKTVAALSSADSIMARNQDFAILAVLLCGGGEGLAHIEDVALKAFQLAPTRFKWERFDYPSLDTVRVALRADRGPDDLVQRSGGKLYSLTPDGIVRAVGVGNRILGTEHREPHALLRAFEERLPENIEPDADAGITRNRPAQKYLRSIRNHDVFKAWGANASVHYELWQLAELLECMPDASPKTWDSRLEFLKRQATFWQDDEMLRFAKAISTSIHNLLAAERK